MFRLSKAIFDLIERSQQDKSMSGAFFLFYCFGLEEGTPPVLLFVCHWVFVMRHGSRQRLSLGHRVLCSKDLTRLQLGFTLKRVLVHVRASLRRGREALMDQNIDTRILLGACMV